MKLSHPSIWYGAVYYPEHWPENRWAIDARMMREAGFNVVRLGEFAWCRMESAEDKFNFDWLGRAIDNLSKASLIGGRPPPEQA